MARHPLLGATTAGSSVTCIGLSYNVLSVLDGRRRAERSRPEPGSATSAAFKHAEHFESSSPRDRDSRCSCPVAAEYDHRNAQQNTVEMFRWEELLAAGFCSWLCTVHNH